MAGHRYQPRAARRVRRGGPGRFRPWQPPRPCGPRRKTSSVPGHRQQPAVFGHARPWPPRWPLAPRPGGTRGTPAGGDAPAAHAPAVCLPTAPAASPRRHLPRLCPHLLRESLIRTVTKQGRIVKPCRGGNYGRLDTGHREHFSGGTNRRWRGLIEAISSKTRPSDANGQEQRMSVTRRNLGPRRTPRSARPPRRVRRHYDRSERRRCAPSADHGRSPNVTKGGPGMGQYHLGVCGCRETSIQLGRPGDRSFGMTGLANADELSHNAQSG